MTDSSDTYNRYGDFTSARGIDSPQESINIFFVPYWISKIVSKHTNDINVYKDTEKLNNYIPRIDLNSYFELPYTDTMSTFIYNTLRFPNIYGSQGMPCITHPPVTVDVIERLNESFRYDPKYGSTKNNDIFEELIGRPRMNNEYLTFEVCSIGVEEKSGVNKILIKVGYNHTNEHWSITERESIKQLNYDLIEKFHDFGLTTYTLAQFGYLEGFIRLSN